MFVGVYAREGARGLSPRFESVREIVVDDRGRETTTPMARMAGCAVPCRPRLTPVSGAFCLSCPRLVNFVPRGAGLAIRCLWTDEDPVQAVMTPEPALVSIRHDAPVSEAVRLARRRGVQHLLVEDNGLLVGVVPLRDLEREGAPGQTVRRRITACPWVIEGTATLAQAAVLMNRREVDCLPVIGPDRRVRGVLTRSDLRRVGVQEEDLQPKH